MSSKRVCEVVLFSGELVGDVAEVLLRPRGCGSFDLEVYGVVSAVSYGYGGGCYFSWAGVELYACGYVDACWTQVFDGYCYFVGVLRITCCERDVLLVSVGDESVVGGRGCCLVGGEVVSVCGYGDVVVGVVVLYGDADVEFSGRGAGLELHAGGLCVVVGEGVV